MVVEDLRASPMMAHLVDSLENKQDIGHYGRLVFAMVARHFLDEEELLEYLRRDPSMDEAEAKALIRQVKGKDYSPPTRDRVLAWQAEQEFPICPDAQDPDACNVYRELKFPDEVYESIEEYRKEKVAAEAKT